MKTTRRDVLKLLGAGAAAPALGFWPRLLHAASPTVTDRYFVFAYFSGGWDELLALDPRNPDLFNTETEVSTGINPAYGTIPNLNEEDYLVPTSVDGMTFGPYIGDLAAHAEKLAVVRGMAMEAVAHQVARRHVLTGIRPAGTTVRGSSVATLLATLLGEEEPIPNLTAGVPSFNLGQPLWATGLPTGSIEDLYKSLSPPELDILDSQRDALETFFEKQRERAVHSRLRDIYDNRSVARTLIEMGLNEHFNIDSDTPEMADLREVFGVDSGITGEGGKLALMTAQALTQGISRCVSFVAADGLDSHQGAAWRTNHGPNLQEGFNSIAALASHLEATPFGDVPGDNWLNHTTIMCFSEFSRTALLNSNGGRDHKLYNSMLLLGGGIRGGQVVGASSDLGMQAQAVDLGTGQVSESGERIGNNHIARTLLHSIGVEEDVGDFRAPAVPALLEDA